MKNVWAASSTGVSIASITVPDAEAADTLIDALFAKTLVADVADYAKVRKVFRKTIIGNPLPSIVWQDTHRITMLTSDERVAELIEECVDVTKNENSDILIR